MNSYLEMLNYIDTIINVEKTASLFLVVWLLWKGVSQLWKLVV